MLNEEAEVSEHTLSGQGDTLFVPLGPRSTGNSELRRDPPPETSLGEGLTLEKEFDLKFRHVEFTESFRRVNIAHGDAAAHREDNEKYLAKDPNSAIEEQKSLSLAHLEPKSTANLREARMHTDHDADGRSIPRHAHNEKEFQHLEDIFQTISPFASQGEGWVTPDRSLELAHNSSVQSRLVSKRYTRPGGERSRLQHSIPTLRSLRLQDGCPPSCTCMCHSRAHIGRGALSGFKSAFGSFTFIFNTRSSTITCSDPACVSRRGQYLQIMYSFPTWLFHAAISATLKDWTTGSPELLLRVHRRIDASMMSTYTSIFGYITRGDIDTVKTILSRREASVYDVAGIAGVSMLYHALRLRQMDVVELLLCEGADVFQLDDAGLGPYHEAIQVMYTSAGAANEHKLRSMLPMDSIMEAAQLTNLHKIAMRILYSSVADYVASYGYNDVNAGDSNNQTPLFYASAQGNVSVVQALLQAGAHPDGVPQQSWSSSSSSTSVLSWTPLSMAARNGHLDVVQLLLNAGAQANIRSKHNRTALHECSPTRGDTSAQETFLDIAACLLAHGADLDVVDNYGSTVLDTTCIRDHARVAAFFIEQGIDTTHRDWEGSNALDNCINFGSLDCTALLLGLGRERSGVANIDDNGLSTLHYVATTGSVELMKLFLKSGFCGLDAELKDNQGRTALDIFNGRLDVTEDLRDTFTRLLSSMSTPDAIGAGSRDSDSDSESPEFFDADESWD